MRTIEIARMIFVDDIGRVLFENRKGLDKDGSNWDYLFFGGKLMEGENHGEAIAREIKEELNYDLEERFEFLGTYESDPSPEVHTIDHVYVARFPARTRLTSKEGRGMSLMPAYSVRRYRIPAVYKQILDDLERKLSDPDFSLL